MPALLRRISVLLVPLLAGWRHQARAAKSRIDPERTLSNCLPRTQLAQEPDDSNKLERADALPSCVATAASDNETRGSSPIRESSCRSSFRRTRYDSTVP